MTCYLYILKSRTNGQFYIGITADLADRIARHNARRSQSTKSGVPWDLVYTEEYGSRQAAMVHERQVKRWKNRARLERLVRTSRPQVEKVEPSDDGVDPAFFSDDVLPVRPRSGPSS